MKAVEILKEGGVVILPTNTVYGFFTRFNNPEGIKKIAKLKNRSLDNPLQVFAKDSSQLKELKLGEEEIHLAEKLLKEPFTLILKTELNQDFVVKEGKIGIRMSRNELLSKILEKTGPLAATSVNTSGENPLTEEKDIRKSFRDVHFVKGDIQGYEEPTSVIEPVESGYKLLRKGSGSLNELKIEAAIGSDHAGFELKENVISILKHRGMIFIDCGTFSQESSDYPQYARKTSKVILESNIPRGILICGTGIGMSISANRFKGIRAALCHNEEYAELARKHNNANILVLGGRFTPDAEVNPILDKFLNTDFEDGRHKRRLDQIEKD